MRIYQVKEIYATLQGEGVQTGRPAVFLRFAGCNLWSGREEDRDHAVCPFCDTDFVGTDGVGGGKYESAEALAEAVAYEWRHHPTRNGQAPYVVCTGGEPALQLDEALVDALHAQGFEVAIETNGTKPLPANLDWVCVSPKAGAELLWFSGDELKLVYPQNGLDPDRFAGLEFEHFLIQPKDGPDRARNQAAAEAFCASHPRWRLSRQMHKEWNIP